MARYRGPDRPELLAGAALPVLFYAAYGYSGDGSLPQRAVLVGRFLIAGLPLFALALAQAWQRASLPPSWRRPLATCTLTLALAAALAVHPVHAALMRPRLQARAALLAAVPEEACLLTTVRATKRLAIDPTGRRLIMAIRTGEHMAPVIRNAPALCHGLYLAWTTPSGPPGAETVARNVARQCPITPIFDRRFGQTRLQLWSLDCPTAPRG